MKQFIFFIFLILIFTNLFTISSLVGATGFSPSSLIYTLKPGENQCKTITINSESNTIAVEDKWAENKNVEWKVSEFNTGASSHGISISYPKQLSLNERDVNVCLSGNKIGEYHGVLLLKEEQQGNSIIQMGVWLKVNIGETSQSQSSSTTTSSSSGSSTTTSAASQNTSNNATNNGEQNQITENKEIKNNGITGGAIGTIIVENKIIIIIFAVCVIIAGAFILIKRKRARENFTNYGYR